MLLWVDVNVSEKHMVSCLHLWPWRWRQYVCSIRYVPTICRLVFWVEVL